MKIRNVDAVAREIPGVGIVGAGEEIEVPGDLGRALLLQPWFEEAAPHAREKVPRRKPEEVN